MFADSIAFLLEKRGSDLTLTRRVGGTYTPATGAVSGTTTATYTIRGVFINYLQENIDGTVIRAGDRRLLVQAKGATTTPTIDDVVDGMTLVDVRTYAPNGTPVAWACQARR
jgi:hypothetical protein